MSKNVKLSDCKLLSKNHMVLWKTTPAAIALGLNEEKRDWKKPLDGDAVAVGVLCNSSFPPSFMFKLSKMVKLYNIQPNRRKFSFFWKTSWFMLRKNFINNFFPKNLS